MNGRNQPHNLATVYTTISATVLAEKKPCNIEYWDGDGLDQSGYTGFRSDCWVHTVCVQDIKLTLKVVRDPCQKITLLLLKSKSVRVIVPESCF